MLRHSYNPHREVRSISCSYQSGNYFVGKLVILESVETSKRMQERGRPWEVPSCALWQTYADINCIMIIKYLVYNRFMKSTLAFLDKPNGHVPDPRAP